VFKKQYRDVEAAGEFITGARFLVVEIKTAECVALHKEEKKGR